MSSLQHLKLTSQLHKAGSERQFREWYVGKCERDRENKNIRYVNILSLITTQQLEMFIIFVKINCSTTTTTICIPCLKKMHLNWPNSHRHIIICLTHDFKCSLICLKLHTKTPGFQKLHKRTIGQLLQSSMQCK